MIGARISFFLNNFRTIRQNLTKFCMHINIDKIYVGIVMHHFSQICNWVVALIDARIPFFLNILRKNWQISTKICIHINIDKIYFGIVKRQFSQICNSYGP